MRPGSWSSIRSRSATSWIGRPATRLNRALSPLFGDFSETLAGEEQSNTATAEQCHPQTTVQRARELCIHQELRKAPPTIWHFMLTVHRPTQGQAASRPSLHPLTSVPHRVATMQRTSDGKKTRWLCLATLLSITSCFQTTRVGAQSSPKVAAEQPLPHNERAEINYNVYILDPGVDLQIELLDLPELSI